LEQALNAPPDFAARPGASRTRERLAWLVAATSLIAALAFAAMYFRPAARTQGDVIRLSVAAPLDTFLDNAGAGASAHPSISPDGRKVAFIVDAVDGSRVLSLRD